MIEFADSDGDGLITFEDFKNIVEIIQHKDGVDLDKIEYHDEIPDEESENE